ncbi:MAG TPA: hypothetical protein VLA06_07710 [Woeseiaceae bacterium]|jgi:hypothetical protein|nr:hypothetical protein [Woeseiaceae bacterium]
MQAETFRKHAYQLASLAIIAMLAASTAHAADDACEDFEEYSYICGPVSAEDLVLIPGTRWVVASGFDGNVALYLVDSELKTWSEFYPAGQPRALQDMATYGACPGSPDPNGFVGHGLHIRPGADGHSTLYVVGHGEREAIEVFDVDANGDVPVLTWTGCVLTPDGMQANSVAALADGSLLATIPLHTGISINEALTGRPTGAVYEWSPGDAGFTRVEGTEMPYANGIEVSDDGQEFYIASSGLQKVLAFSNSNPTRLLRSSETFSFIPDNLHKGSNGDLITAGLAIADPVCGDVPKTLEFDLEKFASCPRPFTVLAVDPESMQSKVLASSPAQLRFSNVTMALEVGAELWIGTFAGDRIAYRALSPNSPGKAD